MKTWQHTKLQINFLLFLEKIWRGKENPRVIEKKGNGVSVRRLPEMENPP